MAPINISQTILYAFCHFRLKNFSSNNLDFSGRDFGEDSGLAVYVANAIDASVNWEDIKWLRGLTSLPIVAKGILRGVWLYSFPWRGQGIPFCRGNGWKKSACAAEFSVELHHISMSSICFIKYDGLYIHIRLLREAGKICQNRFQNKGKSHLSCALLGCGRSQTSPNVHLFWLGSVHCELVRVIIVLPLYMSFSLWKAV